MNKDKLIYILNQYSHTEGSHFFHILNLLEEIAKLNIKIVLIIEKVTDIPVIINENIKIIAQKERALLKRPIELFKILKSLILYGYQKIFIRISTTAALPAILATRLYGGEVYFWSSGTVFEHDKAKPWNLNKIKWLLKSRLPFLIVKKYVHHFVTGPESMKNYYVQFGRVKADKIMILYNDIDTERFKMVSSAEKAAIKNELQINQAQKVILFVHRLSPIKKPLYYFPYILEKFYRVYNAADKYSIYIIGDGEDRRELENKIRESSFKEHVYCLGKRPNKEIHQYYQAADIFINPTYEEGFPRILLEAMASGLPIVTTDAGGIKDILGSEQLKFMVNKDDRDLFVDKLIELARNPNLQEKLSKENLARVQRYSTPNVAKMYVERIFGG